MKKIKPPVLRPNEEGYILNEVINKAKRGEPVLREDVIKNVVKFIKSDMRKNPFRDGTPGDKWFSLFRRRHNKYFTQLTPEQLMAVEKVGFTEKVMNTVVYSQGKMRPAFVTGSPSTLGIPVIRKVRSRRSTTTPSIVTSTPKQNTGITILPIKTETPTPISEESNNTTATDDGDSKSQEGLNDSNDFQPGSKLEVMDFNDKWYPVKVVEVDYEEGEVLVHYEKWSDRYDEWVSMDSNRIRRPSLATTPSSRKVFEENEKVIAVWAYNHKYPATVKQVLPNGATGIRGKTRQKKYTNKNVYFETINEHSNKDESIDNISTECQNEPTINLNVEDNLQPLCFVDVNNLHEEFNSPQQEIEKKTKYDDNGVPMVLNQTITRDEFRKLKQRIRSRKFRFKMSAKEKEIKRKNDLMRYHIRKEEGKIKSIKDMSASERTFLREKWKLKARKRRLKLKKSQNCHEVTECHNLKDSGNRSEVREFVNSEEKVSSTQLKELHKIKKTMSQKVFEKTKKLERREKKNNDDNGVTTVLDETIARDEYRKLQQRIRWRKYISRLSTEEKEIKRKKDSMRYHILKQEGKIKSINQMLPSERKLLREKWKLKARKRRLKLKESQNCHEVIEESVSSPRLKESSKVGKRKPQNSTEEKRKYEREKKRKYRIKLKQEQLLKTEKLKREKEIIKLKILKGLPADYCYQCHLKGKRQQTVQTKQEITTLEDKRAYERERKREWRARKRIEEKRKDEDDSPFRNEPCCCKKKKTKRGRVKKK